jgi:hypothetical protein
MKEEYHLLYHDIYSCIHAKRLKLLKLVNQERIYVDIICYLFAEMSKSLHNPTHFV